MEVYHIVYKTVNLLNNKFYIGVHKSAKLMDEYLGSGKWIKRSIIKYGRENFIRENLFIFLDSASAYGKEAEIVSLHLKDPLCMNLKQGGMGGFDFINENGLCPLLNPDIQSLGSLTHKKRFENVNYRERWLKNNFLSRKSILDGNKFAIGNRGFSDRKHSEETKSKMSKSKNVGCDNPAYGTCWITNGQENKKIKLTDLQTWVAQGWERGRK